MGPARQDIGRLARQKAREMRRRPRPEGGDGPAGHWDVATGSVIAISPPSTLSCPCCNAERRVAPTAQYGVQGMGNLGDSLGFPGALRLSGRRYDTSREYDTSTEYDTSMSTLLGKYEL